MQLFFTTVCHCFVDPPPFSIYIFFFTLALYSALVHPSFFFFFFQTIENKNKLLTKHNQTKPTRVATSYPCRILKSSYSTFLWICWRSFSRSWVWQCCQWYFKAVPCLSYGRQLEVCCVHKIRLHVFNSVFLRQVRYVIGTKITSISNFFVNLTVAWSSLDRIFTLKST